MNNELLSLEDELLALRDRINALHQAISAGRATLNADGRLYQPRVLKPFGRLTADQALPLPV